MSRSPRSLRRVAAAVTVAVASSGCLTVPGDVVLPPLAAASAAVGGGTLRVGIQPPGSIHPTLVSSPDGQLVARLVCDTLVHLDPKTGEVLPGLAEQIVVSGDGKALTFKIRRGVLMHDGTELTARDVVASIHRIADANEGSYLQSMLDGVVGFGKYSGRDLEEGENRPSQMAGVETLERYGMQVRLVRSDPQFVRRFAHPALAPMSEAAVEANPLAVTRDPACAGAYQVDGTYDPDAEVIRLVRDEQFVGSSPALTNGGAGYVDTIEFHVRPDADAVLAAYEAGEVDVARVPTVKFAEVAAAHPASVVEGPHPSLEYIGFPVGGLEEALGLELGARDRFNELAARHMLSLALDRERLAAGLHDGARRPARSLTSPSAGSYHLRDAAGDAPDDAAGTAAGDAPDDAELDALPRNSAEAAAAAESGVRLCDALLPPTGDREWARRLRTSEVVTGPDGGVPVELDGSTVPFYFNDEFGNEAFVQQVARQWQEQLGLQIEPVALTWEQFLDRANSGAGFDGFHRLSWQDDGLVPEGYLRAVADQQGPANLGRFSDETVQRLFAELTTRGGEDHLLDYHQLEDVLCAMAPVLPVTVARSRWLVRDGVIGTARDEAVGPDGLVVLRELFREGPS